MYALLMEEGSPEQVKSEVQVLQPGVWPAPGQVVSDDRPCLVCGYNLRSMAVSAQCPECGTPVERSLRGILLRYSSPDYVATMRRGITLVEASLVLQILMVVVGIAVMGVFIGTGTIGPRGAGTGTGAPRFAGAPVVFQQVQQLVTALVRGMTLLGWWMFSTPDPALLARDPGHGARRILRIFLACSAVLSLAGFVAGMLPGLKAQVAAAAGTGMFSMATFGVLALIGLAGAVAQLVGFIASMNYMMQLARRIPDAKMERQAERYRWLLPVIYVPGILACGLGPLVAFVMYLLQIDGWRRRMKDLGRGVLEEEAAAGY